MGRAWIMGMDPPQRASLMMATEYERKLLLWLTWCNYAFIPISLWYWYGQFTHLSAGESVRSAASWSSSARKSALTVCARRGARSGASVRRAPRRWDSTECAADASLFSVRRFHALP